MTMTMLTMVTMATMTMVTITMMTVMTMTMLTMVTMATMTMVTYFGDNWDGDGDDRDFQGLPGTMMTMLMICKRNLKDTESANSKR